MTKGQVITKVVIKEVESVINLDIKVIVLDDTNAISLLEKFEANKSNKKVIEEEYEALQADIYALLGYTKFGKKWIGVAEEGTLNGLAVVKVATQNRTNFDRDKFVQANPDLLGLVQSFTENNVNTVLKTVR